MIKTVIFDIGNVLTAFAWEEFLHSFGLPQDTVTQIAKASVEDKVWREFDLGVLSDEEILQCFIRNAPQLREEIQLVYRNIHGMIKRADYAIPWIRDLKARGYQVLVLSNFSKKALDECSDAMDFLKETDGGILSFREHLIKPMPEIYELLLNRYQLCAEQCVFIDDLPKNIEGASELGIQTILFTGYEETKQKLEAKLAVE